MIEEGLTPLLPMISDVQSQDQELQILLFIILLLVHIIIQLPKFLLDPLDGDDELERDGDNNLVPRNNSLGPNPNVVSRMVIRGVLNEILLVLPPVSQEPFQEDCVFILV